MQQFNTLEDAQAIGVLVTGNPVEPVQTELAMERLRTDGAKFMELSCIIKTNMKLEQMGIVRLKKKPQ